VCKSRWYEDVYGREIATVATNQPAEEVEAAQARGRARDLAETVAELIVEMGGDSLNQ
jgi:hypothetical protein